MMTSSRTFYNNATIRIDGCLAVDCTNVDAMGTMTCDKLLDICSPVTSVSRHDYHNFLSINGMLKNDRTYLCVSAVTVSFIHICNLYLLNLFQRN